MPDHALVVGATGVAGGNLCQYLAYEKGWTVTAVFSRRRTGGYPHTLVPPDVRVIIIDLTAPAYDVRLALKHAVGVTHVFYCAWTGSPNVQTLSKPTASAADPRLPQTARDEAEAEINLRMLQNVVASASDGHWNLRRVVLLQGTKWYGVHLGPDGAVSEYKTPFEEEDPRVCYCWYMLQQDWIERHVATGPAAWDWTALRPFTIVGRSIGSPMNLGTGLAVLFTILRAKGATASPLSRAPSSLMTRAARAQTRALHTFASAACHLGPSRVRAWQARRGDVRRLTLARNVLGGDRAGRVQPSVQYRQRRLLPLEASVAKAVRGGRPRTEATASRWLARPFGLGDARGQQARPVGEHRAGERAGRDVRRAGAPRLGAWAV